MTWVKLEDDVTLHPKLLRLSDGAVRLWLNGLAFANRAVTDGKIDKALVASLNHHGRWTPKQLAAFVAELVPGLWVDRGDHFEIHDYAHHQREAMKDRVERKRELDRVRQQRKRDREDETQRESLGLSRRDAGRDNPRESRRETSVPARPGPIRTESSLRSDGPASAAEAEGPPTAGGVLRLFREAYEQRRQAMWPGTGKHGSALVEAWIADQAERLGATEKWVAMRLVDGFFADAWAASKGFPWGALSQDPARYFAPPGEAQELEIVA